MQTLGEVRELLGKALSFNNFYRTQPDVSCHLKSLCGYKIKNID